MIIAGETSGDLHGGGLVECLKRKSPDMEIFGIGGDRMANGGMELLFHVDQLSFLGFGEVVRHLPFVRRVYNRMVGELVRRRPDLVVLIDYPGFNLRFAKKAKRLGFRVFYYIAPQVWAWGESRAKKMARYIDKLAVVFAFEVPIFTKAGLDVEFVGHPLLDLIDRRLDKKAVMKSTKLKPDKPILALLPGSRKQEVEKLLPSLLESSRVFSQNHPETQIVVVGTASVPRHCYFSLLDRFPDARVIFDHTYEILTLSTAALVASGTATLEAACFGVPFAVVYKLSPLSFFLGKRMVKIPNIGLVNVVAGKKVVSEVLQNDVCPSTLVPLIEKLLFNANERKRITADLRRVRNLLGRTGAAERTAKLILSTK